MRLFSFAVQLADTSVDQLEEIQHAVGNGGVGIDALFGGVGRSDQRGLRCLRLVHVLYLGCNDHVAQDFLFHFHAILATENHLGDFLQGKQPERQYEVVGIEHVAVAWKGRAEFVVRVEQQYADVGPGLDDLAQHQGNRGGFTHAGGAHHGEMPAEQFLEIDLGFDRRILGNVADANGCFRIVAENGSQIA